MTLEEMKNLPQDKQKEIISHIKAVRKKAKVVSYSAMYGVGATKLARGIESSKAEAQQLLDGFWKLNWAVEKVANRQKIKVMGDTMWLQNPVSGFWHNLRSEKDAFSTLNQSTGVFCFDTWLYFTRTLGLPVAFQFHDEQGVPVKRGEEHMAKEILKDAIGYVNKKLKLNVLLDVDVQFGDNYGKVH